MSDWRSLALQDQGAVKIADGWLRLRVSVSGREVAEEVTRRALTEGVQLREPVEFHRIDVWPITEDQPPAMLAGPAGSAARELAFQEAVNRQRDPHP